MMYCMTSSMVHSLAGPLGIGAVGVDGDGFSFVGVRLGRDIARMRIMKISARSTFSPGSDHSPMGLYNLPDVVVTVCGCMFLDVVLTGPSTDFLCTFASGSFELVLDVDDDEDDGLGDDVSTSERGRRLYVCFVSEAPSFASIISVCFGSSGSTFSASFAGLSVSVSTLISSFSSFCNCSCLQQLSHLSGSGSSEIKLVHASQASQIVRKNSIKSGSLKLFVLGILTVKFLLAAVTIFTSPSKAKRRGASCVVSEQLPKISCNINLANVL